jgi:hypoxanthine phosphoribosyltransferase
MTTASLQQALQNSDLVHDRIVLETAIRRMAMTIRNDYAGDRPVFLTMMNGGMIFASLLAIELGIDVEFDYLHASRYRGRTEGAGLIWSRLPVTALRDRRVLLVDDILDEGLTLDEVVGWCREQGARDVRIAVLAWKRHDRCLPGMTADYVGVEVPDRYVYGFGMDYYEQGRNLPAIYALR